MVDLKSRAEEGSKALNDILKDMDDHKPRDRLDMAKQIYTLNVMIQTLNDLWLNMSTIEAMARFEEKDLAVYLRTTRIICEEYITITDAGMRVMEASVPENIIKMFGHTEPMKVT